MNFLIFNGTARKGQKTEHITKYIQNYATQSTKHQFEIIDPRELNIDFDDEGQSASPASLTKKVTEADGYIIVTPEYNHGYPGSLKYMLDLNLKQYIHKPVTVVGTSSGPFGGTRVIEALTSVVRELGMVMTFTDVHFGNIGDVLDDNGKVKDPQTWNKRIDRMLTELLWMAQTLKYGRENIPSQYHETVSE